MQAAFRSCTACMSGWHAGGGDERTLLGLLSAVDRRVAKLRQRADADADAARDAIQQAQHAALSQPGAAPPGSRGGGDEGGDVPNVQALADAASQLHQARASPATRAVHAINGTLCMQYCSVWQNGCIADFPQPATRG